MRKILGLLIGFLIMTPAYAAWQVANPFQGTSMNKYVLPELGDTNYPQNYVSHPQYSIVLKKGFLKKNIGRIAKKYHWRVKWLVSKKHLVLTNAEISAPSFSGIMDQLLRNYTLKATYDRKNHIMTVKG